MRRIDRYISREVFSHALLGLLIFTFVLFIPQIVRLMELLVRHGGGADAGTVAMLVACALPQVLTFTVPMAVLVGVMIGLGRMSADSEIIALHALGVGLRRILFSVGVVAAGGAVLTLAMTMWAGPAAVREFREIEQRLRTTQASFDILPRVFDERFPGVVLYVQDVEAAGTRWRGLLLASNEVRRQDGNSPGGKAARVTLAEEAVVIADRERGRLQLHLRNGSTHEYASSEPDRYAVTTFGSSDLPVTVSAERGPARGQREKSMAERNPAELWQLAGRTGIGTQVQNQASVEFHRRVALPLACVVFALAGVPMGARPRRGGRAAGFVITLLLICGYYLLFVTGAGMAQRGTVTPWIGLWAANLVTAAAALVSLPRVEQVQHEGLFTRWAETLHRWRGKALSDKNARRTSSNGSGAQQPENKRRVEPAPPSQRGLGVSRSLGTALGFPLLMDFYVLRSFFSVLVLVLAGFVLLFESFTFFEILGDITDNSIPAGTVAQYFLFLTPHLLYQVLPLAALVAALGTLGVLAKNNELTAFKASGTSLYRLAAPLLLAGVLLAAGMFTMDSTFLPYSNQKQDSLRNFIKKRPAQTFYQPRGQWIFGQNAKLYNYEYFDPDQNRFAGLNVFELDPATFQMRRRVYAARAHWEPNLGTWVLQEGWVRDLDGARVSQFVPFPVFTLAELSEPPEYFKREVRPYYQMDWQELNRYIEDLQLAGFDVARLSTQWHRKFAFPLLTPIIVLLAVPFALLVGTRGAVGGVAVGMLIAIAYWATSALFEAMGAVGQLPPVMAAWAPDAIFAFVGAYFFLKMPT